MVDRNFLNEFCIKLTHLETISLDFWVNFILWREKEREPYKKGRVYMESFLKDLKYIKFN